MIALLSILGLLALTSTLIMLETMPWPIQRTEPIHDTVYWEAVQRDTAAYLATHKTVESQIRQHVADLNIAATQKLGGLTR